MNIKLYHGTSSKCLEDIIKNGTSTLYLTLSLAQAEYYAECASEEDETEQVVCIVEVPIDILKADLPSFNEPLSYILKHNDIESEDDWHDMIENGEIPYPQQSDWKTSLKFTQSVVAIGKIKPEQIISIDQVLSGEEISHIEKLINSSKKFNPN